MRRALSLFILLSIVVGLTITKATYAQQSNPECSPSTVIDAANKLKSSGDAKKDLQGLLVLRNQISAANIACTGLTFEGKKKQVFDPFDLPKGTYKLTATTKGYLVVELTPLNGDCGIEDTIPFNLGEGDGNDGAEDLLKVTTDCHLAFSVDNVTAPWKLTFEPFGDTASTNTDNETVVDNPTPEIGITVEIIEITPTPTPKATLIPSKTPAPTKTLSDAAANKTGTAAVKQVTATFIADHKTIDRRELVNYPDDHKGESVVVKGRIFNINSSTEFQMFLAGSSDAAVYVNLRIPMKGIYENDFVTVYGVVGGSISFENTYGSTISQPLIDKAVVTKP